MFCCFPGPWFVSWCGLDSRQEWAPHWNTALDWATDRRRLFCWTNVDQPYRNCPCVVIYTTPYTGLHAINPRSSTLNQPTPSITDPPFRPTAKRNIFAISFLTRRPLLVQGLIFFETHSDTRHSVGLPWMREYPFAQNSTWQHTTLKRERYPCPRRDSNPQSQQANGHCDWHYSCTRNLTFYCYLRRCILFLWEPIIR